MTETSHPSILVDSNIIIDIITKSPQWFSWSRNSLDRHSSSIVNPIIYTELCYQDTSAKEVDELLHILDLDYQDLPRKALHLAAQAFQTYRKRGGTKNAPLPNFFIGAHAAAEGYAILTRDPARYKTYFPTVQLICP